MSSLGSTAVNRDTNAVDYLNYLRNYAASQQAQNSAGTNLIPDYGLQLSDAFNITDSVALGANEPLSDTIDITDSLTQPTSLLTGQFQITDDSGAGVGVTQPGKCDFADCG